MSLFGALSASVAGLDVQSNALGIISDNIANVSTVGYKAATATFESLVTNSAGTGEYTPGGVLGGSAALVTTQGLLQTTSSPTDIAISGGGLFVTNTEANGTGQTLYTRAGAFTQNAQGNFVNTAGLFLQAWPLDRNGQLPGAPGNLDTESSANLASLQTVNVQNLAGTASATSTVALGANLNSSQAVLAGAKGDATMDALDSANYPITGSDIIVPTGVDSIAIGNSINIATGKNPSGANYVYGGFTFGRNLSSGAVGQSGIAQLPTSTDLNPVVDPAVNAFASTGTTVISPVAGAFVTAGIGTGVINVTVPSTAGMFTGQQVEIVGPAAAMDAHITSADMTGTFTITVVDGTHISFVAKNGHTAVATGTTDGAGGGAETITKDTVIDPVANAFVTAGIGTGVINVTVPSTAAMYSGQTVAIQGPSVDMDANIKAADMSGNFVITVVDLTHFSFVAKNGHTAVATGTTDGAGGGAEHVSTGSGTVNITVPSTANMRTGQYINLTGPTLDANISSADLTGSFQITVVNATTISVTAKNAALAVGGGETAGAGSGTEKVIPEPFVTTTGASNKTVTVDAPANALADGDVVTFSGITAANGNPTGTINGIPVAQLNTSFIISNVTTDSYQITVATTGATAAGGAPADAGTITEGTRPYAGNVLDADNASQALLGVTGTANIDPNALSFTINTSASGTIKFTYVPTDPNVSIGQFTTLNDLANAISDTPGLTARIVNNRLWVSASDPSQAVTFANTQSTATAGPPVLAGIDWVNELGLENVPAAANTFNSLNSLAALVNTTNGLSASVVNPTGTASLNMSVVDPTDTITFKDNTGSSGSLLSELGLAASQNSGPVTLKTVGPNGPAYDPSIAATNMASGKIPPQFSYPITVYDGLGTAHTLNVAFAKLQNNTWAVEIFAQPATDITPVSSALIDGQVATGTVTFNGDGSLENVSTSLSSPFAINWSDGSTQSNVTFNWGTAGQPLGTPGATVIGGTNGLSQFDSGYNVSFANQNGAPVGQLTGISIATTGIITASYSNGETQSLYQIPLASFTDPNELAAQSGDAYGQSNGSGIVNLKQAGSSGVGTISAGALESSNSDLASELTDMIVAQRAYQANSKVIQTADSLLNDLDQVIQ